MTVKRRAGAQGAPEMVTQGRSGAEPARVGDIIDQTQD